MKLGYLAVGHEGTTILLTKLDKSPRQQLLKKLGVTHAEKIYQDKKEGGADQIGYAVNGIWFHIYEVHSWTGGEEV